MVRHYDEPVQRNKRKTNRDLYPASMNYITNRIQFNSLAKNSPDTHLFSQLHIVRKYNPGDE